MDKLTTVLIIAQNGLKTAASVLSANAKKTKDKAGTTTNAQDATKLKKKAEKAETLAKLLLSTDAGITAYLASPE